MPEFDFLWWIGLAVCSLLLLLSFALLIDFFRYLGYFTTRRSVAGSLIVLTGAGGGLGRALALEFARRGAVLALWDIRADALDELVNWLMREHGVPPSSLHSKVVDVADAAAVAAAAEALNASVGPARVILSNAAIVGGVAVLDASAERLRTAFDVNALSHFWLARAFLPQMLSSAQHQHTRARGVFVTMGSLMAELPAARLSDYCATKAATAQLHECLRWELQQGTQGTPCDVRCLHVQPYMVDHRDSPLFAGGTPVKLPWLRPLVPPLRAATVARRVASAVEGAGGALGIERLVLPYHFKWLPPVLMWLPTFARDLLLDLAGAGCAMDGFVGRQPTPG